MPLLSEWRQIQICKMLLFSALSNQVLHQNRSIEGLHNAKTCAEWGAQWLKPHCELLIKKESSTFFVPDVEFELYLLLDDDRHTRDRLYFSGKMYKFSDRSSPALSDAQKLDQVGLLGLLFNFALEEYGYELEMIYLNDPDLQRKAEKNDAVLRTKLKEYYQRFLEI